MQTPHTSSKKSSRGQGQRERQPNWTIQEDEALCKSWLHISEDAVVGTDQQRGRLWDRIRMEFINNLKQDVGRNSNGLMNRWSTIQQSVSKFSGYLSVIERARISGYNAEDNMGAATILYFEKENHHFKWETCWLILKDTSKWYRHVNDQREKQKRTSQRKRTEINLDDDDDVGESSNAQTPSTEQSTPTGTPTSVSLDDEDGLSNHDSTGLVRPDGRKIVKGPTKKKKSLPSMDLFAKEFANMRKETSS
ncbi:PREDICTED: uncharacterized protein LOC105961539 [Erythranthe guttata]|uniref:uncharacterized protein LOC105961539 n=1 Tax=Erythranthe guttata TaxID=4155 RepID=UPI00064DAB15|nr:PREDICTED: uncharacterized protein LOC105961539 [Erythranthe guttata]|eukprot:XP_012841222.1 PREDICTED: uncharacterized protein LOC105961539 [Erythranthe guttata]